MLMKGIEKITDRIAADAAEEIREIQEASRQKCEGIRGDFDKKAEAIYEEQLRSGLRDAQQQSSRIERGAQLDAKKELLALRQDMVGEAFKRASEMVSGLAEDEYLEFMLRLAVSAVTTGKEEIVVNSKDRKVAEKLAERLNEERKGKGLDGELRVAAEAGDMTGGFLLRQGNVEINCTLDLALTQLRGQLAGETAKLLFGE